MGLRNTWDQGVILCQGSIPLSPVSMSLWMSPFSCCNRDFSVLEETAPLMTAQEFYSLLFFPFYLNKLSLGRTLIGSS